VATLPLCQQSGKVAMGVSEKSGKVAMGGFRKSIAKMWQSGKANFVTSFATLPLHDIF